MTRELRVKLGDVSDKLLRKAETKFGAILRERGAAVCWCSTRRRIGSRLRGLADRAWRAGGDQRTTRLCFPGGQ